MESKRKLFRPMIGCIVVVMWIMCAQGADEVDEMAQSFLECMRLAREYGRHYEALSPSDKIWKVALCSDRLRIHSYIYEDTGRLAPGFKEALLMRYNFNQTLVDIEICDLDFRRCPDHVRKLSDELFTQRLTKMMEALADPILPEPEPEPDF